MIKKITGLIFALFGLTGLSLEINGYYTGGEWDIGGVTLALLFIIIGSFLFYSGWRGGKRKEEGEPVKDLKKRSVSSENSHEKSSPSGIKIISIIGIIFSSLTLLLGILVIFFGGILISSLIAGGEGGWGILGIGTFILGLIFLFTGIIRLIGYIMLMKIKKVGWITIIALEGLCLIYRSYLSIEGFAILFAVPLIWSLVVLIYLGINRDLFFLNSEPST